MTDDTPVPDLHIIAAAYGLKKVTTQVVDLINRTTSPPSLSFTVNNATLGGDPWPGYLKSFTLVYRYGDTGAVSVVTATEGAAVNITAPSTAASVVADVPINPTLSVLAATYGPKDVTATVQGKIDNETQTLSVVASNGTFGDTWPGTKKTMVVVAAYTDQVPFVDIVQEGNSYSLKYRPPLQILSATWGLADVTSIVRGAVSRRALTLLATDASIGVNGWPGATEALCVVSQYADLEPRLTCARSGSTLVVDYAGETTPYDPAPDPRMLNVIAGAYGGTDVTSTVVNEIQDGQSLDFTAGNALFDDPWPGVQKSFLLTYAYGPGLPSSLVVPENSEVLVSAPPVTVDKTFVTLGGLFGDGDILAFQASNDMFWDVGENDQIIATASSAETGVVLTARFLSPDSPTPPLDGALSLEAPDGTFVVVGTDGTLYTGGESSDAALFVPSLTTSGSMVLSVVGGGPAFSTLAADGSIIAFGTEVTTLDTSFSISIKPTAEGTQNHLAAFGLSGDLRQADFDFKLAKVIWDLTGGWFLALGLGPRIADTGTESGIYALIQNNARASKALSALWTAARNNPEATLTAAFFAFEGVLWGESLGWPILRMLFTQLGYIALAKVLTKVIEWAFSAPLAVADALVSFAIWGYDTTMDVLAYVNSRAASTLALPELAVE